MQCAVLRRGLKHLWGVALSAPVIGRQAVRWELETRSHRDAVTGPTSARARASILNPWAGLSAWAGGIITCRLI